MSAINYKIVNVGEHGVDMTSLLGQYAKSILHPDQLDTFDEYNNLRPLQIHKGSVHFNI